MLTAWWLDFEPVDRKACGQERLVLILVCAQDHVRACVLSVLGVMLCILGYGLADGCAYLHSILVFGSRSRLEVSCSAQFCGW
jgi:hypothetical protein